MMFRLCMTVLRTFAWIVPRRDREDWLREWEAEIGSRRSRPLRLRPVIGSFYDAAWLRRQFTLDAELVHDARHGARLLRRHAGVSLLALALLSIGIGSAVAVYSVVDTLLVRELPYRESDRIVTLWQTEIERPQDRDGVSPGLFLDWRDRAGSFSFLAAAEPLSFDYLGGPEPITLVGAGVTQGFFEALGVTPAIGRSFLPEEHAGDGAAVAILSDAAWRRHFGADPPIVGRTIVLDGRGHLVVGVLPRWFHPDVLRRAREQEVWTPQGARDGERENRRTRYWSAVGRLAPGVTLQQARLELASISAQLAREYPRTLSRTTATLVPLRENLADPIREPLVVLSGAVALVLLLACANASSLLLSRAMDRQREFAVRGAVGAGRSRLIRQMLGESVVLAGAAAACGIGLAHAAITASVARASIPVSHLADLAVDARVALFAAALAAAVTILVGLWPALRLTRGALQGALQEAATALTPGPRRRRFAAVLLTGEVAMALVLLASAGLLVRSFLVIANVDPGFVRTNVAVLQVFAYGEQYRTSDQTLAFFGAALERLQNVPGVEAAGLVSAMPFLPANINIQGGFRVEGRPEPRADQQPIADLTVATGGYFTAMRIPLRAGRLFSDEDRAHSRPVAIVNEQLAERYWPDGDPVGHRISVNWQGRWRTMDVIGMVGAIRHESLDADPRAEVFIPLAQLPFGSMTFVVRTSTDPVGLLPALKARIWDVDPALPLYDTATVDALVARSLAPRRVVTDIVGALAALAFVLAASGIYGIVSFATLQRTREFALRMAVGGTAADIRRMVFRDTLPLIAAGLAAGLLGVVAVERIIASLLYGVSPRDPLTLTATSAMLAAAAIAACYLPARRATRIDPLSALRAQ